MSRKAWLAIAMLLCLSFPALAQKITVTGTVVDPMGEPLTGASIIAEGTTMGTAADLDGNYRLDVDPNAVLVVSYVGYDTQRIAVEGRTVINVTLSENTVMLKEVVAIGYGVVKKSDATGSVAVVKPDDIEAGIATSTQDLLVGASPGVVVTSNGGDPTGNATIRIRGGSSLTANNDPLIVIDGVAMTGQAGAGGTNALTMINPQNIESMTILKDASATAIYGSRASNGVIIITTKKGAKGKPQVNFAANFHVNTARNTLDMMSAAEFADVVRNKVGTEAAISQLGAGSTDWQKEVLRTSFSHDYSLSVGGSVGELPYRVNASFTDNQGILKTSGMQRTTVGISLTPKFFNNLLQITANVNGTYIKSTTADTGAVGAAVAFNPTLPVRTAYATKGDTGLTMFNGYTNITLASGNLELQAGQNPLQMLEDIDNSGEVWSSTGNLQIDYALHFLPDLHLNLNAGYQVSKNTALNQTAENSVQAWSNQDLIKMGAYGAGTYYKWWELQRNTSLEFYLNYRKEFEAIKSNVDATAGYTWQHMDYFGHSNTYLASLGFNNINYADGAYNLVRNNRAVGADGNEWYVHDALNGQPDSRWGNPLQLLSFFGRVNYTFDNTYLLTFTLRDDATSRFHKDTRWGLFPALALGWKITNMSFMESTRDVLNEAKLRLGWGVTGQQDIGQYFGYLPVYTSSTNQGFQYIWNGQWINPLYPNAYDENLKWEETTTWNAGLDLAFLNNRITASIDWYLRETDDLLAYTPVAGMNTANYMTRNIGSLRNVGIEATVGAKPVVTKDFTWNTSVNVAWNRNKITALTGDAETSQIQARDVPTGTGGGLQYHLVGEPAFSYLVYQQVYDAAGNPVEGQYVDQNADGIINDDDKIIYHSPDPKVTFTWNNSFNYKNWDLGISLRANLGNYVYNAPRYSRTRLDGVSGYMLTNLMRDEYLFNTTDGNLCLSDYFVENASFIRCDNITLGYTFPELLNKSLKLRLFGAVQNPFVITKYKGLDPESFDGIDNNMYPRPITCTLGVVATF
ncbi:MAG: SusC/RagA family TonB-linked outer membrane protein [Muribaculaceae bacterium]